MAFDYSGLTLGLGGAAAGGLDELMGTGSRPGDGGTPGAVGGLFASLAGALTPHVAASGNTQQPVPVQRISTPSTIPWGMIALAGAGAILAIVILR